MNNEGTLKYKYSQKSSFYTLLIIEDSPNNEVKFWCIMKLNHQDNLRYFAKKILHYLEGVRPTRKAKEEKWEVSTGPSDRGPAQAPEHRPPRQPPRESWAGLVAMIIRGRKVSFTYV